MIRVNRLAESQQEIMEQQLEQVRALLGELDEATIRLDNAARQARAALTDAIPEERHHA